MKLKTRSRKDQNILSEKIIMKNKDRVPWISRDQKVFFQNIRCKEEILEFYTAWSLLSDEKIIMNLALELSTIFLTKEYNFIPLLV